LWVVRLSPGRLCAKIIPVPKITPTRARILASPEKNFRKRATSFRQLLYSHLLSEEATMVRFVQATISGGKKVYFNADRISAILESSRSDSKSIVYTSGDAPFQVMEDPATLLQQLGVSSV